MRKKESLKHVLKIQNNETWPGKDAKSLFKGTRSSSTMSRGNRKNCFVQEIA